MINIKDGSSHVRKTKKYLRRLKKILFMYSLAMLMVMSSCSPGYNKLSESEVDSGMKYIAENPGTDIFFKA
jgi:hypothetical protein